MPKEKKGYSVSDIYQGGYSTFSPTYGETYTGYRVSPSQLGVATDARLGNVIQAVADRINTGQKVIEVSFLQPETIDAIPKQHLKEAKRVAELTGMDLTVHGPLVEPSGIHEGRWSESGKASAERQMIRAMEASHDIDAKGNIPVTIHTSNGPPGIEWDITKEDPKGKRTMFAFDQERKQIVPMEREIRYFPRTTKEIELKEKGIKSKKGEILEALKQPEERIDTINATQWENEITAMVTPKDQADKMIAETEPIAQELLRQPGVIKEINGKPIIDTSVLTLSQQQTVNRYRNARDLLGDIQLNLSNSFEKAYKYGSEKEKKRLKEIAKGFEKDLSKAEITSQQSKAIQGLMRGLKTVQPKQFIPLNDFLMEKSSDTFSNVALKTYKKYGEKSPTLTIENPPAGFALSRGEEVRDLVEKTRKEFVEKAMKPESEKGLGMSKGQAEQAAEKFIGVTWDVGHINQIRKYGFSKKDTVKEAEKVKHLVKHVHLSDNFGSENTELPMGMGNVAFKEVMEKLGKKGEDAKKIVEAAHWWMHQKTSPIAASMEALGSPIYAMHMQPYWNQAIGFQQGYFSGYGQMLPQINYETFGAGFSQLPAELGGQKPGGGAGGRMSGRPME